MIVSLDPISLSEVDRVNADFEFHRGKPKHRRDTGDPYRLRPAEWFVGIECRCGQHHADQPCTPTRQRRTAVAAV